MRLRIVSGEFGGRFIEAPAKKSVHPMSERMRGALFNSLGDISDKTVLDAFAGSGAVGLEAISRGAQHVTFIEKDKKVVELLEGNIAGLGVAQNRFHVTQANVYGWADKNDQRFDIVVADPPYVLGSFKKTVDKLKNHVTKSGIMILSHIGSVEPPGVDGVVVVETRSYANGSLSYYRSQ